MKHPLRNLVAWVKKLRGATPNQIELYFLELNIQDGEAELDSFVLPRGECCHSCYFFPRYSELCDLQDRRRKRRDWLLSRLSPRAG